ncbi:sec-independent protein translocase protein TatB [Sanguibacter gelidistatuariae]|uniref:Sec-independent protein translocase protein TatB n=1 Tax=Sanguibacter gelidistatuariae TaxID=1814289 RepID=A0A1G6MI41_9MICO|nr:hypothetical protein [Sanguibacter gelidistatuariae]SDC54666.1 sec-independent protein translocase protein TatB [Sanguibacter gelidistatuariae]
MFGINGGEFIILLVIAVLVIGPERLPGYAEQLAGIVRKAKTFMADAKVKVSEELGPEIGEVDWAQLDPRRYDPRRIVRDALLEDTILDPRVKAKAAGAASAAAGLAAADHAAAGATSSASPEVGEPASAQGWPEQKPALDVGALAPFDAEAT